MKITVFGASGRVGKSVIEQALLRGHKVTAFVHSQNIYTEHQNLNVIQGDIHNPDDVTEALKGSQAVISTLGSWGTKSKDILTVAMKTIVPIMEKREVGRVISLTGSDALWSKDRPSLINRLSHKTFAIIAPNIIQDGEEHIQVLQNSTLAWTVIRSPAMNDLGSTKYVLRNNLTLPFHTINREAVAAALVDQLDSKEFIGCCPVINRH